MDTRLVGVTARHPAKYTDVLIPIFAELLEGTSRVIDPFAGTCKLVEIRNYGYTGEIYCNEIEREWAMQGEGKAIITIGDAAALPYPDDYFDAACTSVTYGNRMADHHNAKDGSRRNTYKHSLGRDLTPGNTGMMQYGEAYAQKHVECYRELRRVLRDGARFVLNVSDHIRRGEVVPVTLWHIVCLRSMRFELVEHRKIETPRLRFGANRDLRVSHESVITFRLRKEDV